MKASTIAFKIIAGLNLAGILIHVCNYIIEPSKWILYVLLIGVHCVLFMIYYDME